MHLVPLLLPALTAFASMSGTALADARSDGGGPVVMTLDQLKEKCLQLQNDVDHGQMKPFTINVECSRERTYWTPVKGALALPEETLFAGGADVKGRFVVPAEKRLTDQRSVSTECMLLEEWRVASFKVPLTLQSCKDLLPVASLPFFCARELKCRNLDEAEPVKTGRRVDTCASAIVDGSGTPSIPGPGPGQKPDQNQGQDQNQGDQGVTGVTCDDQP